MPKGNHLFETDADSSNSLDEAESSKPGSGKIGEDGSHVLRMKFHEAQRCQSDDGWQRSPIVSSRSRSVVREGDDCIAEGHKEGFLLKKSSSTFSIKSWQKRWFQIEGERLSYTECVHDPESAFKTIMVEHLTSCSMLTSKTFEVVTTLYIDRTKPKVYILKAKDEDEAEHWVGVIANNIKVSKAKKRGVPTEPDVAPLKPRDSIEGDEDSDSDADVLADLDEDMQCPQVAWSAQVASGSKKVPGVMSFDGLSAQVASGSKKVPGVMSFDGLLREAVKVTASGRASLDANSGLLGQFDTESRRVVLSNTAKGMRGPGINPGTVMPAILRRLVSKKKKRYEHNGFSLDLAYITPQIIAMGYPSDGVEGAYRNSFQDVVQFFDTKHASSYLIYNLCSERTYNYEQFHNRVAYFPFADHNPPPFEMMRPMCESMGKWIDASAENVCGVHCKAGKGRTGVMIVAYLLHCGMFSNADEAIAFYGNQRTFDGKGVTIRSQQRYCQYFFKNLNQTRPLAYLYVLSVRIYSMPEGVSSVTATVMNGPILVTAAQETSEASSSSGEGFVEILFDKLVVCGDVQIAINDTKARWTPFMGKKKKANCGSFWFHTSFIEENKIVVAKNELDGPPKKDKKDERFRPSFRVEAVFETASREMLVGGQDKEWGITLNDHDFESFSEYDKKTTYKCRNTGISRK